MKINECNKINYTKIKLESNKNKENYLDDKTKVDKSAWTSLLQKKKRVYEHHKLIFSKWKLNIWLIFTD